MYRSEVLFCLCVQKRKRTTDTLNNSADHKLKSKKIQVMRFWKCFHFSIPSV